ncbi:MAG: ATP-binding protein, partial [Myxococcota bacterium]
QSGQIDREFLVRGGQAATLPRGLSALGEGWRVDKRYQDIFELAPVSLWEEDFTEVMVEIAAMRARGISDFATHFAEHPDLVEALAARVKIVDVNRATLTLLGLPSKDALLGPLDRLVMPDSYAQFCMQLIALAEGRSEFSTEAFIGRASGERIYVHIHLVLLPPRDGVHTALVCIQDISIRRKAEEELRGALQRSRRELAQFAYVASHDLQEPLRMVASYAQLFRQRYADTLDSKASKYIGYMVEGALRIRQLIRALLAVSNIDTEGRRFAEQDMGTVVGKAIAALRDELAACRGEVIYGELPAVYGDRGQLIQLFGCIFGNSIKFRSEEPPRIEISARPRGSLHLFEIRDNGVGFNADHYGERIFEMFQRLYTRDRYPGAGIGLTIARKIVERHGGRIWTESEPGCGATFFLTLPGTAIDDELDSDTD